MNNLLLSLAICTHNPRHEYLHRVLESLKNQSFSKALWELLLIDNGSQLCLANEYDLSWHVNHRHIREDELGLTPARLRAIAEAKGELILFVDDDNILDKDYLEIAIKYFSEIPILGVLGAGNISPEIEQGIYPVRKEHFEKLAIRHTQRPFFSNELRFNKAIPYGAGLCIKRKYAEEYANSCKKRKEQSLLGRRGNDLLSGEDVDMALYACKNGELAGVVPDLRIIHLISNSRFAPEYLIRIAAGHAYSHYMLSVIWKYHRELSGNRILSKIRYWRKRSSIKNILDRLIFEEEVKAVEKAKQDIRNIIKRE